MFGLRHVDTGKITLGEHHTFGAHATEVVIAEIVTVELPVGFDGRPRCHRSQPAAVASRLSAYSVTAISAALAESRFRASTEISGT